MKIIRDTREKVGYWDFSFCGHDMEVASLKTGDYSVYGYEDLVCIERKKSVHEIAVNVGKDNKRFEAELERMNTFKYRFIIMEFSVADVLSNPKIPNTKDKFGKNLRVRGPFIMKTLEEYEKRFDVEVIFAGNKDNAMEAALEIFEEAINDIETRY